MPLLKYKLHIFKKIMEHMAPVNSLLKVLLDLKFILTLKIMFTNCISKRDAKRQEIRVVTGCPDETTFSATWEGMEGWGCLLSHPATLTKAGF